MIKWLAILTLAACEHGQTPEGVDAPSAPGGELGPLVVRVCVSGDPSDPACEPVVLPLDQLGLPGSQLGFVINVNATGLSIDGLTIRAGGTGLRATHPQILVVAGDTETLVGDFPITLDLRPDDAAPLDSVALPSAEPSLLFRFEAIGPQP